MLLCGMLVRAVETCIHSVCRPLNAYFCVPQGLLSDYCRYLQTSKASAAGSTSSSHFPASAAGTWTAPAETALWPLQQLHQQQQHQAAASTEPLGSTLRPNPLFSASVSSGEHELFGRNSVNGLYSTLLSPVRQPAAVGPSDTLSATAAGGGCSRYSPWGYGSTSSSTGSTPVGSTPGVGSGTARVGNGTALRIEEYSNTMSNPVFRGRAVLEWMLRHSNCGSLNSTGGSAAGGSFAGGFAAAESAAAAAAAAAAAGAPQDGSTAATAAAAASGPHVGSIIGGSSSSRPGAAAPATTTITANNSAHSTASQNDETGPGSSSLPSNLAHSLASTGFSTDSEALGQFVEEQVATDNFTITTETAPNTTHFQGKQLKAAAAAAAARAAAARARAAGADAAAVAAAAEAAAAAVAAAGASAAAPPTISEEDDEDYEIEFSEDGQVRARG